MTASVAAPRLHPPLAAATGATAALGCGLLAARPALIAATAHPFAMLVVLFVTLLLVGVALPIPGAARSLSDRRLVPVTLMVGILAFGAGRVLVSGHPPSRVTMTVLLGNLLAAVAEEVWFRRLCYGLLAPAGTAVAVAGSTALFALVHVSIYGFWILPLDLAAGALFGWQRAITGSCVAPAITHMVANLFVLL